MQKHCQALPAYEIVNTEGQQHQQTFTVECSLPERSETARATASSRRLAEQKSASLVLRILLDQADN